MLLPKQPDCRGFGNQRVHVDVRVGLALALRYRRLPRGDLWRPAPMEKGRSGHACFCLAKSRPASDAAESRSRRRRTELSQLKPSQLRREALAAGVDPGLVEDALDGESAQEGLIALMLDRENQLWGAVDSRRQELAQLRLKELRARAKEAGVEERQLEDAIDSDDPRGAVIELLLLHPLEPRADSDSITPRHGEHQDAVSANDGGVLRAELSAMKLSELRKRAHADGVDEQAMEDASDGDDEGNALIALIAARQPAPATQDQTELWDSNGG
jgi:hypothetical protein